MQFGAQMRCVPFGQGVPVIDSGEEQRPYPGRDLPQQPSCLFTRHRAVPRAAILKERRHNCTFRLKILPRIVPTVVRFFPCATPYQHRVRTDMTQASTVRL